MSFVRTTLLPALLGLALVAPSAHAHEGVHVRNAWARATVPGAVSGGVFLTLDNAGPDDRLVAAHTDAAGTVELHRMRMDGDVMRMEKLDDGIPVPRKSQVMLKPGGLHIMLHDLKAPLAQGASFPLQLDFEKAGRISVSVKIEGLGAQAPGGQPSAPAGHMH